MKYGDMNKEQAEVIFEKELRNFKKIQGEELSLDMSRGKPCTAQLDLANVMFDMVNANASFITENGMDVRNYGGLDGIPEMKKLFAALFGRIEFEYYVQSRPAGNAIRRRRRTALE